MVISVLTLCALLHCECDLKAAQVNMHCSNIWELMLYNFELDYNAAEAAKNTLVNSEGTVDYSAVTRWFKKFCSVA